jgi:hypothetical protein
VKWDTHCKIGPVLRLEIQPIKIRSGGLAVRTNTTIHIDSFSAGIPGQTGPIVEWRWVSAKGFHQPDGAVCRARGQRFLG